MNIRPRIFVPTAIDVLIAGGQGTYDCGKYHTEWPDNSMSLLHMGTVGDIAADFRYQCIVVSGGFTQKETPELSEAESFFRFWQEHRIVMPVGVIKDEVALDSAENVMCGLMALRLRLQAEGIPYVPIGRIGYYTQWQFKRQRMTALSQAMAIVKQFYFHGCAKADDCNAETAAKTGEEGMFAKMKADNDFLLRGPSWEAKRSGRYRPANPIYKDRNANLRRMFPAVFKTLMALDNLYAIGITPQDATDAEKLSSFAAQKDKALKAFQAAFRNEVLEPSEAPERSS